MCRSRSAAHRIARGMIKLSPKPIVALIALALILTACSAAGSRYHGSLSGSSATGVSREAAHAGQDATKPRASEGAEQ